MLTNADLGIRAAKHRLWCRHALHNLVLLQGIDEARRRAKTEQRSELRIAPHGGLGQAIESEVRDRRLGGRFGGREGSFAAVGGRGL